MGKIDSTGEDKEEKASDSSNPVANGNGTSEGSSNGGKKVSLLEQMLMAGIDQRQKEDERRRRENKSGSNSHENGEDSGESNDATDDEEEEEEEEEEGDEDDDEDDDDVEKPGRNGNGGRERNGSHKRDGNQDKGGASDADGEGQKNRRAGEGNRNKESGEGGGEGRNKEGRSARGNQRSDSGKREAESEKNIKEPKGKESSRDEKSSKKKQSTPTKAETKPATPTKKESKQGTPTKKEGRQSTPNKKPTTPLSQDRKRKRSSNKQRKDDDTDDDNDSDDDAPLSKHANRSARNSNASSPVPNRSARTSTAPSPVANKSSRSSAAPSPVPNRSARSSNAPSPVPRDRMKSAEKKEADAAVVKPVQQSGPLHSLLDDVEGTSDSDEDSDDDDDEENDAVSKVKYSTLSLCLEALHRTLQRKDINDLLTFPLKGATPQIASQFRYAINRPMDFITMSRKISEQQYKGFVEFREDFVQMCRTAMSRYKNKSRHHRTVKKIYNEGMNLLSDERIKLLNAAVGFPVPVGGAERMGVLAERKNLSAIGSALSQRSPDHQTRPQQPHVPLHQPQHLKEPQTQTQLLSGRKPQSTTMNQNQPQSTSLLMPVRGFRNREEPQEPRGTARTHDHDSDDQVNESSRAQTVQRTGTPSLQLINPDTMSVEIPDNLKIGYKSPERKRFERRFDERDGVNGKAMEKLPTAAWPINYLQYGPYGSFGPQYDSSRSNINKQEADMLLHAYTSQTNSLENVLTYVEENHVDRMLNILRGGEGGGESRDSSLPPSQNLNIDITDSHTSGTLLKIDQSKVSTREDTTGENNTQGTNNSTSTNLNVEDVMSLKKEGIDVSFLNEMFKTSTYDVSSLNCDVKSSVRSKLQYNRELLYALQQSQYERLSSRQCPGDDIPETEVEVALSLTDNMKELIGLVKPRDIVSAYAARKAMGVCE